MLWSVSINIAALGAARDKASIKAPLSGFKTREQIGFFPLRTFATFWDLILTIFAQYYSSAKTNLPSLSVAGFYHSPPLSKNSVIFFALLGISIRLGLT